MAVAIEWGRLVLLSTTAVRLENGNRELHITLPPLRLRQEVSSERQPPRALGDVSLAVEAEMIPATSTEFTSSASQTNRDLVFLGDAWIYCFSQSGVAFIRRSRSDDRRLKAHK